MKEVEMPSGAVLKVAPAPFAQAKELYQALLKEIRDIEIRSKQEAIELYKNLFSAGFSSKDVERCFWKCAERCTYNLDGKGDLKVTPDVFEPLEARQDFVQVCIEVGRVNVDPFVKSLWQALSAVLPEAAKDSQTLNSPTTHS